MFNYGILTWTTGVLSGGNPVDGLGGNRAVVSIFDFHFDIFAPTPFVFISTMLLDSERTPFLVSD